MKKHKEHLTPSGVDKNTWEKMVEFTEGFGYMIVYLAVITIVLLMIKDIMI